MPVDMKALLALPQKERRRIAERLWDSLEQNHAVTELSAKEQKLLEKRWNAYIAGEIKFHSPAAMRKAAFGQ